jgi:hypothetical protein
MPLGGFSLLPGCGGHLRLLPATNVAYVLDYLKSLEAGAWELA